MAKPKRENFEEEKSMRGMEGITKFKVKTPVCSLMVEAKGSYGEYPGVYISFSEDGKSFDVSQMIACVEYIETENEIHTETYVKDKEDPTDIREWETGRLVHSAGDCF